MKKRRITVKYLLILLPILSYSYCVSAAQLTIEAIHSDPAISGKAPRSLKYSPDGQRVTYLQSRQEDFNQYDLWEYHLKDKKNRLLVDSKVLVGGDENLSDEEKARRERKRLFGKGIMEYSWSKDGTALLFPLNGDVYHYSLATQQATNLTQSAVFETDARFSPKGSYVSYIRKKNLFIYHLASKKEQQITNETADTIKHAMAEFIAQEEMGRMTGYWWSDDERKIAFTRIDESMVKIAQRNEIYADTIKVVEQRYPYTGTNNASIELAVFDLKKNTTQWIDTGKETDFYIPRVKWLRDNIHLSYQWQSRDQQRLRLVFHNTQTNKQEVALLESSNTWINLHNDLYFLKNNSGFIWSSERDGFRHLYFYSFNTNKASPITQLTQGPWIVDNFHVINEKTGDIYFSARKDTPLEKHLYKVNLSQPKKISRLSSLKKYHAIEFADDGSGYIDQHSTISTPPQVSLHDSKGKFVTWLEENRIDKTHPFKPYQDNWIKPKFGTLKAQDGQTLHYTLYKPKHLDKQKKYPAIVNVYGGPQSQQVVNRWNKKSLLTQVLVQNGYIVFQLDNRGSYNRGKKFEDPIYKKLGEIELQDQIAGVKYLHKLAYIDPQRIGVYGHSYGGYMTLMAMFKAGEYFKAGVSGAPVTDWSLYDTHYTERYLGHPATNINGYKTSAVFNYTDQLNGALMIYHGMADDNVLFTHSTKLYKQLQDQGILFEMANYPGSKHSMNGKKVGLHLQRTVKEFFDRKFK